MMVILSMVKKKEMENIIIIIENIILEVGLEVKNKEKE